MKVIIIGAGFTGTQLAKRLIADENDIVLIDKDEEVVRHASNRLDCMVVHANGNSLDTLIEVGIAKADALVAVTESDELNMITCSLVQSVYPKVLKIARVRNEDYYPQETSITQKEQRALYGIDFMVHPDFEAADAIVNAVEHGAITDVLEFDDSPYEVARVTIEKGSQLDGASVQNIRHFTKLNFLIAYVEKDGQTFMPTGATILQAESRIGILANKEILKDIFELCGSKTQKLKKIALVGAGRIGNLIAEHLIEEPTKQSIFSKLKFTHKQHSQDFVIIDDNDEKAKFASEKFKSATVYKADITDESFIEEEDLSKFDLVIAATNNHEKNIVTAAYFKSLGVDRTIALVSSGSFALIARNIGIDVAVPIKDAVIDSILSHLKGKSITGIHTVAEGELEIIEIVLSEKAKIVGKMIKEISKPGSFIILLIKEDDSENYKVPDGNTTLEKGDKLVIITKATSNADILQIFGADE